MTTRWELVAGSEGEESDGRDGAVVAARRRAALVAAVAGLALVPYFLVVVNMLTDLRTVSPPPGAPANDFVDFYVDNFSRIPLHATAFIVQWVITLVLLVAVVRSACVRLDLAATVAITLAGASTAVYVFTEGLGAWPALSFDMNAAKVRGNLDASVAEALVLSRDGLHAAASVLVGISLLVIAWLLARSDLWGHWLLSVLAVVAGVSAMASMVLGPEFIGPGLLWVWGIVVSVVLLVARSKLGSAPSAPSGITPATPKSA
jgi:hypothetical protein